MLENFNIFLIIMSVIAVIVFIALYFVTVGYGVFYNKKWGFAIPNKIGWILMESLVFIAMILLCVFSERSTNVVCLIFLILFEIHYFQRSSIFPFLIRGKSVMPLSIILMGVVFALWTFANLAPRAAKIYDNYKKEFGNELDTAKVKRILPFIY